MERALMQALDWLVVHGGAQWVRKPPAAGGCLSGNSGRSVEELEVEETGMLRRGKL